MKLRSLEKKCLSRFLLVHIILLETECTRENCLHERLPYFVKTTVGTGKATKIIQGEEAVKHLYSTKVDEADDKATAEHIAQ
eukprot:2583220-Amphidinium_carterae.1